MRANVFPLNSTIRFSIAEKNCISSQNTNVSSIAEKKMYFTSLHFFNCRTQKPSSVTSLVPFPSSSRLLLLQIQGLTNFKLTLSSNNPFVNLQLGFNSRSYSRNWRNLLQILFPSSESQLNLNWVSTGISSSSISVIRYISVFEFQPCGSLTARAPGRTGHITSLDNKHLASRLWNYFVQNLQTWIGANVSKSIASFWFHGQVISLV